MCQESLSYLLFFCTPVLYFSSSQEMELHAQYNIEKVLYIFMFFFYGVAILPLHPVVLLCGCSQSTEAVRTGREKKRGKPHKEEGILSHSDNYSEHGSHACAIHYKWSFHCSDTICFSSLVH